MSDDTNKRQRLNREYLRAQLLPIFERLLACLPAVESDKLKRLVPAVDQAVIDDSEDEPAFAHLCRIFGLSHLERYLLLLCIGVELDPVFARLCNRIQQESHKNRATLNLMMTLQSEASHYLLAPDRPLVDLQLINVEEPAALLFSPLRVASSVFQYVTGNNIVDQALTGLLNAGAHYVYQLPSHVEIATEIQRSWSTVSREYSPILNLYGADFSSVQNIAQLLTAHWEAELYCINSVLLSSDSERLRELSQLLLREAYLKDYFYLLVIDEQLEADARRQSLLVQLIKSLSRHRRCLLVTADQFYSEIEPVVHFKVPRLTAVEQKLMWQAWLPDIKLESIEQLAERYDFNLLEIQTMAHTLKATLESAGNRQNDLAEKLLHLCREKPQRQFNALAQRIEPKATWDDLILPLSQQEALQEITCQVTQRYKVYEEWGFAAKSAKGLGISALFAGPSGTGKTLAAEVIAHELQTDLYHVDLSAVVSKYIGETEKNLKKIFDMAEYSGAILLFDEADALFGKRTEVRDSHDRHANIEISYLLQRMEAYRGLSILTTNLKSTLDTAFLRRLRFVVDFQFPDVVQRRLIWQQMFPKQLPRENLDFDKLARLIIAGGSIRGIAVNAAFIAARSNQPLSMRHLLRATQQEYTKLGKILNANDVKDWLPAE